MWRQGPLTAISGPGKTSHHHKMRGKSGLRVFLAAILLCSPAIVSVEGHGRALQGQQSLHLPKDFKIPNIFNTREFAGAAAGSGGVGVHSLHGASERLIMAIYACQNHIHQLKTKQQLREELLAQFCCPLTPAMCVLLCVCIVSAVNLQLARCCRVSSLDNLW